VADLVSVSGQDPVFIDGAGYKNIRDWVMEHQQWEERLYKYGYLVFRNFPSIDTKTFDELLDAFMHPSQELTEETSPRSSVSARLFTSTDYPPAYPIQFHHEFSYRETYPDRVAFCCLLPPESGGATPIADSRKVLRGISPDVVAKFERLGVSYVRNFTGLGVSWPDSFGTHDKAVVSSYCEERGISYSWHGEELSTRQVAPAVRTHAVTRERVWFNSVLNLNIAGVEPKELRDALKSLPASSVPANTTYGSGEAIEPEVLEHVQEVYAREGIRFSWQAGDLLLIDNLLTAHAREPYSGERRIVVGMGSALARSTTS
jgi:alpha-ketoglutarate-dependent taurine dioxygenase